MSTAARPNGLQTSKSYSVLDGPLSPQSPSRTTRSQRANTIQNGSLPDTLEKRNSANENPRSISTAFAKLPTEDGRIDNSSSGKEAKVTADVDSFDDTTMKSQLEELPIELVALTDTFIDSLTAKVHSSPPDVQKLSDVFQDFYALAATNISTHIATLSSRLHRGSSPATIASRSSIANSFRAKAASISQKDTPKPVLERRDSQQMLTTAEIAERKKARKALELKRVELEEAVERRVCQRIYDRIWRHRSTQDEAQDEKLRSKTAALSVVGIGIKDLGIDLGDYGDEVQSKEKESEVRDWLQGARDELVLMDEKRSPLEKLQHLKAAHKGIVDTLAHFHPSSSADEIMPMLIYTLITSRPQGVNIMSNLYFIQRFRNETKIDGEAAYCLTNLEAAVTFLETVDLASLRDDESLSGPLNTKAPIRPASPVAHLIVATTPSAAISSPTLSPAVISPMSVELASPSDSGTSTNKGLRPQALSISNRRLSDLFQPPAQAFGAASDALVSSADQGLKTIGNSLGDSYKFLLGKLKERQEAISEGESEMVVPRTLDEARRLVSTPPLEEGSVGSRASSIHSNDGEVAEGATRKTERVPVEDRVLNIIGGKPPDARDRSVDSSKSSGSNKRVAFAGPEKSPLSTTTPAAAIGESMRNLGNSLNPISRLGGFGTFKAFGRAVPVVAPLTPTESHPSATANADGSNEVITEPPAESKTVHEEVLKRKIALIRPPNRRFMEVQNPGELRINEVLELLRDYRRLATAIGELRDT